MSVSALSSIGECVSALPSTKPGGRSDGRLGWENRVGLCVHRMIVRVWGLIDSKVGKVFLHDSLFLRSNRSHTWRDAPSKTLKIRWAVRDLAGTSICPFLRAAADPSTAVGMTVPCCGDWPSVTGYWRVCGGV